jgi:hypothetical protein
LCCDRSPCTSTFRRRKRVPVHACHTTISARITSTFGRPRATLNRIRGCAERHSSPGFRCTVPVDGAP